MKDWLLGFLGIGKPATAPIGYDQSKELLGSTQTKDRLKLAANGDVRPEVLYFLAKDSDPSVRRAVAGNANTPAHADLILAKDGDDSIRGDLARKIAKLAPTLNERDGDKLQRLTYQTLEILIQDQAVRVRQIISETVKDMPDAPHEMILRLARDPELVVAGPVLQYSPVLTDQDLMEVLSQLPIPGSAAAIARRVDLSPDLAHVIGTSEEIDAVTALLKNKSAQIREETLDLVIARAPQILAWHRPLVDRPRLSDQAVRNLARFVAQDLIRRLQQRVDLKSSTAEALEQEVLRRIDEEDSSGAVAPAWEQLMDEAKKQQAAGKLEEADLTNALGNGQSSSVRAGLAVRADLPYPLVEKILNAQSPKGVTALVWRAKLPMRFAVRAQTILARVPPLQVLKPTVAGEYPISEESMVWQIDFFRDMMTE